MDYAIPPDLFPLPTGFKEPPMPLFDAPPSQDELFARLQLARSRRIGPATFRRLIAEHGDALTALLALPWYCGDSGRQRLPPRRGGDHPGRDQGRTQIRRKTAGPWRTRLSGATGADRRRAPIFWAQGQTALLAKRCVAIVGTRNASSLALRMARALGRDLAQAGIVVVSGLARGVDAVAHSAALEGGTIAVHAGGLDRVYPAENVDLAAQIAAQGCALSERPFGYGPQARDFPRRNRIVSGLSLAVVVVEAAARSGSMITARDALDQGREVMAVPGHPMDGRHRGATCCCATGQRWCETRRMSSTCWTRSRMHHARVPFRLPRRKRRVRFAR